MKDLIAIAMIITLMSVCVSIPANAEGKILTNSEKIALAQLNLNTVGCSAGMFDGKIGKKTIEAIKCFQFYMKWERTGKLSDRQMQVLNASAAIKQAQSFLSNNSVDDLHYVQNATKYYWRLVHASLKLLDLYRFPIDHGMVTIDVGDSNGHVPTIDTVKAIKTWQRIHGSKPTGVLTKGQAVVLFSKTIGSRVYS